jgi:hypothetical protein
MISESHKRGVGIYAWITGLVNFKEALKFPDQVIYCKNGQPNIYSGKIHNNKRFAVLKANAYTPEFARNWAKEMVRSIDMFGWEGCRWDWYFIPDAPNDPLYLNKKGPDWYNSQGVASRKLFPHPDKSAAIALTAWRQTVNAKYPDFVYGTNIHAKVESFKRNPEYCKVACTNSMVLYEYLLGITRPKYNTWQKWAKNLTEDVQRARPYGAQPIVGFMQGLLPNSVALNLATYVCYASGAKWWGSLLNLGENWTRDRFMIRFSEYYFDNAFRLIPEARREREFKVAGNNRIFWKQFVYERQTPDGREVTVHLINLPESDYICQRHEAPPLRKNIKISVAPSSGQTLQSAWVMTPHPLPTATKLRIENGTVVIPELVDAAIVLFKYRD